MKNPLFVKLGKYSYAKKSAEERVAFHSRGGKAGGKKRAELLRKYGWNYWRDKKE